MDRLTAEQARRNALTRDAWGDYAGHRQIVTDLLLRGRTNDANRLCVVGAGNANDLDLGKLCAGFREIHLVDLDSAALQTGVSRQQPATAASIVCHGGIDVTSVLERLTKWDRQHPPSDAEIAACIVDAHDAAMPAIDGPFDVVASTCLLSQLIELVAVSLDASHPRFLELLMAVRDRHLHLLVEMVSPGGLALYVIDFLSSDTCPELATIAAAELPSLLAAQLARRNFFTGANPQALAGWFDHHESLRESIASVQLTAPWRWAVGPRIYAVCAIAVRRR